jgi:hypothetical protein
MRPHPTEFVHQRGNHACDNPRTPHKYFRRPTACATTATVRQLVERRAVTPWCDIRFERRHAAAAALCVSRIFVGNRDNTTAVISDMDAPFSL